MTPDELEQLIDQFEEVLITQFWEFGDKNAKQRAEILADSLGATNTASLLRRAIHAKNTQFARRHIESARGSLGEMKRQNRVW